MNKNVMVKGLTALTILTSLGFAEIFLISLIQLPKQKRMSKKLPMQLRHHTIQW